GLRGSREIEAATTGTLCLVDDAVEVRTNAVRAALLEGMAGRALLGGGGALLDRGGLQQLLDRLGRSCRFLGAAVRSVLLHGNLEAGLFRHRRRENRMSGKARHQHENAGAEDGTDDLVEFEGVHNGSGSRPGNSTAGRRAATVWREESAFCAAPSARLRYRFAPPLATRINAAD